jgi:hypothetical protein
VRRETAYFNFQSRTGILLCLARLQGGHEHRSVAEMDASHVLRATRTLIARAGRIRRPEAIVATGRSTQPRRIDYRKDSRICWLPSTALVAPSAKRGSGRSWTTAFGRSATHVTGSIRPKPKLSNRIRAPHSRRLDRKFVKFATGQEAPLIQRDPASRISRRAVSPPAFGTAPVKLTTFSGRSTLCR